MEVLRALARNAELIVMDEPTAALTKDESERLFEIIRRLQQRGVTILYVSHFLHEVLALADTVTVLRDGAKIQTTAAQAETPGSLVTAMLGRSLDLAFPAKEPPPEDAKVVLSVRGLTRGEVVKPTDLDLRAGEIVGVAGLIGSGRSELARLIFGADRPSGGTITIDGQPARLRGPHSALRAGIAMLPESRKEQGLSMNRSISENITLTELGKSRRSALSPSSQRRRKQQRRCSASTSGQLPPRIQSHRFRAVTSKRSCSPNGCHGASGADRGRTHARRRCGSQARDLRADT